MKEFVALTLCVALWGCSSSAPTQQAADADKQTCVRETPVGTNFPVVRCRTTAERDRDRQEAQKVMESVRTGPGKDAGS